MVSQGICAPKKCATDIKQLIQSGITAVEQYLQQHNISSINVTVGAVR
mgnify:CR=1 FL=1